MSKKYINDSQTSEIVKYISDNMKLPLIGAGGGFAPIGTINFFDATVAPLGWLACDGSTYNIADYPELATYYASVHGSANFYGGDGTTTFAVPDLQGEFLRGSGTNSHTNQGNGANVGVHQDASYINPISESGYLYSVKTDGSAQNYDKVVSGNSRNYLASPQTDLGGQKATTRPTNTSFLICVKATLSDAEINAFNVYTPREHQVAWWEEEIDGVWKRKPVYEKEINGITPAAQDSDFEVMNITSLSIERVVQMRGTFGDNSEGIAEINYLITDAGKQVGVYSYIYNNVLHMTTKNRNRAEQYTIQLRYTKSTDDWQTS